MKIKRTPGDWIEEVIGVIGGITIYMIVNQHIIADLLSDLTP